MSLFGTIAPIQNGLDYHQARHALLTSNLANVDTPGFRPQDAVRVGEFGELLDVRMRATSTMHLGATAPVNWRVEVDEESPAKADGNAVSLDREAVKIAANNLRYETIATLVQGQLQQLEWAAQDGRNA